MSGCSVNVQLIADASTDNSDHTYLTEITEYDDEFSMSFSIYYKRSASTHSKFISHFPKKQHSKYVR